MAAAGRSGPRAVIIGGGFGGLYASRVLGAAGVPLTVVDARNFHLFQPLLYQVATGGLSPGDIASPIRAVLARHPNARVLCDEAVDVSPAARTVSLRGGMELPYDVLVVAAGSRTSYFGKGEWEARAAGLKTVEDALRIRQRVLGAFERAEAEPDTARREALLTFVVVGAGPTGVELAGAIAELSRTTLARDYRAFDPARARIVLLELGERVLPTFPPELSQRAHRSLERLGAEVRTGTRVTHIDADRVEVQTASGPETIATATVLWAAGVTVTAFADRVAGRFGAERDRTGRLVVGPDLTLPGHPEVYVIGDLAHAIGPGGAPLPGVAPVAMQEGRYVARRIIGAETGPFRYRDKGQLAVIGRHAAVCDLPNARFSGRPAWFLWLFIHIAYLVEYDNKVLVLVQWAFNYITRKRGARLITHGTPGDA